MEFHLGELQEQLGSSEAQAAQSIEELGDSLDNAHMRVTDVQANLREQKRATADVQQSASQALANTRQLCRHLGNAVRTMVTQIMSGEEAARKPEQLTL